MADVLNLPARKGTIQYDEETLQDIANTLANIKPGECVRADLDQDTETKARDRAKKVRELLLASFDFAKVKAHAIPSEDDNGDEVFVPAVSLPIG